MGPENALKALSMLGGGAFLPVHWGTFCLAMHAWDEPAEVLYEQGPKSGARLLMPRIGEAVEPAHDCDVKPWWRIVDKREYPPEQMKPIAASVSAASPSMPWPID